MNQFFFIILSSLSLIMISMFFIIMLFIITIIFREIVNSSNTVNWIFHCQIFWDYLWYLWYLFLRLLFMKYGLILLRYSSTDSISSDFITVSFVFNIIITPKVINSYWFIVIFFFFFTLRKILNIAKNYVFNSFNSLF